MSEKNTIYMGILLLNATSGSRREARGLIGRAIDAVLGKQPRGSRPFDVRYLTNEERDGAGAAYTLTAADWQLSAICDVGERMSIEEGWDIPPFQAYWDYTVPQSSFTKKELRRFRKS